MPQSYDLTQLDPTSFEHMAISLAMRELGAGVTAFGPGPDAGRDGYFEGEAPYPARTKRHWDGRWYLQAKFRAPSLGGNPQTWLVGEVKKEIAAFKKPGSNRKWPDNWIIITNVDPSGAAQTGAFDRCRKEVEEAADKKLASHFDIWGGAKVLSLLSKHQDVARTYGHFLTPGHILTELYEAIRLNKAGDEAVIWHLIVTQLWEQQYARLEQARLETDEDSTQQLQQVFVDLPFRDGEHAVNGNVVESLLAASTRCHAVRAEPYAAAPEWTAWRRHPHRARTWFIRGGPGQGKSTLVQFFAQLQRSRFLLEDDAPPVRDDRRDLATDIRRAALDAKLWPAAARIPVLVELKEYAEWFGERRPKKESRRIITYLAEQWHVETAKAVTDEVVERLLSTRQWFFVFDGLDEVPGDVKDAVAAEVRWFLDDFAVRVNADILTVCTSRPQGYSGQFAGLDACFAELLPLEVERAIRCAEPLLRAGRTEAQANKTLDILRAAAQQPAVRELMTTPLQSHIMAVVVRAGGKPPERRWALYERFYQVIRTREKKRELLDENIAAVLADPANFLKTIHARLGFVLHASAEKSEGAQAKMEREAFRRLVTATGHALLEQDAEKTIQAVMDATTERLVLVNTPDDGNHVRFDVRQLQEFFAGEFFYDRNTVKPETFRERLELVAGDAHWREAVHFLLSGLVINNQGEKLAVAGNVLRQLDAPEPDGGLLNRRLARGAMIVARLLGEGTLEDDPVTRGDLRDILTPLLASTDRDVLAPLITDHPNTRAWLIETLLGSLKEPGTIAVLASILPDGDPRVADVVAYLNSAPAELFALITRTLSRNHPPAGWFLLALVRMLETPRSTALSGTGLMAIVGAMKRHATEVRRVAKPSLDARSRMMLDWLLQTDPAKHDFTTDTVPAGLAVAERNPPPRSSLLYLLHRIARFASRAEADELREVAETFLEADETLAYGLPSHVAAQLPIDFDDDLQAQWMVLTTVTPDEVRSVRKSRTIRNREIPDIRHGVVRFAHWGDTGISELLFAPDKFREPNLSVPGRRAVALRSVFHIGRLAALHSAEIRRSLAEYADQFVPVLQRFMVYTEEWLEAQTTGIPSIQLPAERSLLPHLVAAVDLLWDPDFLESMHIDDLRAIRDDPNAPAAERLAAIVIGWAHPAGAGLSEAIPRLRDLYDHRHAAWFLEAAVIVLERLGSPLEPTSRAVANQLIDMYRDRDRDRWLLDRLFAFWREVTAAPATQADAAAQWLDL